MMHEDRIIVKNSLDSLHMIPRINKNNSSNVKVHIVAFDGTGNHKDKIDWEVERETSVGYLTDKLREENFKVDYYPGPGVDNISDAISCGSCSEKANNALVELRNKIESDWSHINDLDLRVLVIGFSRGGAIGRHFMNMVSQEWPYSDNSGISVRTYGLIFDTVATNTPRDFQLGLSPTTNHLVHIIAQDERRKLFAVTKDNDLLFIDMATMVGTQSSRLTELTLPGAHSDIGGSYKSGVGSFYRVLGEISLYRFGFTKKNNFLISSDFFTEGYHDSRGYIDKLLLVKPTYEKPNETREAHIVDSKKISVERMFQIKLENEQALDEEIRIKVQYDEVTSLVFELTKYGQDIQVSSRDNIYSILRVEEDDEIYSINYQHYRASKLSEFILPQQLIDNMIEGKPSLLEIIKGTSKGKDYLGVVLDNKMMLVYK